MSRIRHITTWLYTYLAWINLIWIAGVVILAVGAWILGSLPGGDAVIYPLQRFSDRLGAFFYVPVSIVLIMAIVLMWPMMIQWGIGRGDSVIEVEPPNLIVMLALLAFGFAGHTIFNGVNPPQLMDRLSTDEHVYMLSGREYPLAPTEVFLYECDRDQIFCDLILRDQADRWNIRMTLDLDEDAVRILNLMTVVYSHPLTESD